MLLLRNAVDVKSLKVPAINARHAFSGVSDRYHFIDTKDLVEKFVHQGWVIKSANQSGVRGGSENPRFGFQKHRVELLYPKEKVDVLEKGELFPSLEIINSHDGRGGATRVNFGFLRLACLNGLLVSTDQSEELRIHHALGGSWENWMEVILNLTDRYSQMARSWDNTVSTRKRHQIAKEALLLRLGEDYDRVDTDEVLTPIRDEDKTETLWGVYNILQERLTTGNFRLAWDRKNGDGSLTETSRKGRPLVDIHRNTEFQKGLWQIVANAA